MKTLNNIFEALVKGNANTINNCMNFDVYQFENSTRRGILITHINQLKTLNNMYNYSENYNKYVNIFNKLGVLMICPSKYENRLNGWLSYNNKDELMSSFIKTNKKITPNNFNIEYWEKHNWY